MFTGIVESTGKVLSATKQKGNLLLAIECGFAKELVVGQSVSHNGVCLTIETRIGNTYTVTAIAETLRKTNLGQLKKDSLVNLERSLKIGERLDGHFVQGHVDTTAICTGIKKEKGSHLFTFSIQEKQAKGLLVDKGSICINGVSLTLAQLPPAGGDKGGTALSVAIIPHTFKHTNFSSLKKGDAVNIEFDVLGKYISKLINK